MTKRGRPPIFDEPPVKVTIKMTAEQKAKLERLGGAKWVRQRIDRAKDRKEPEVEK